MPASAQARSKLTNGVPKITEKITPWNEFGEEQARVPDEAEELRRVGGIEPPWPPDRSDARRSSPAAPRSVDEAWQASERGPRK